MYEIEHCYDNGDLQKALEEAADWVERVGEDKVKHVIAYLLDVNEPSSGWYVDVVYENAKK